MENSERLTGHTLDVLVPGLDLVPRDASNGNSLLRLDHFEERGLLFLVVASHFLHVFQESEKHPGKTPQIHCVFKQIMTF